MYNRKKRFYDVLDGEIKQGELYRCLNKGPIKPEEYDGFGLGWLKLLEPTDDGKLVCEVWEFGDEPDEDNSLIDEFTKNVQQIQKHPGLKLTPSLSRFVEMIEGNSTILRTYDRGGWLKKRPDEYRTFALMYDALEHPNCTNYTKIKLDVRKEELRGYCLELAGKMMYPDNYDD